VKTGKQSTQLAADLPLYSAMDTRSPTRRVCATEIDWISHPGSEVDDAHSLMERGFAIGGTHHSMFSDGLASSERILAPPTPNLPPYPCG